jgi:hypothetical protein
MKRQIICDRDGLVLGMVPVRLEATGPDAPAKVAILPTGGQQVHVVDVPRELEGLDLASLRRQFRVALRGRPRLAKIPVPKAKPAEPPAKPEAAKPRPGRKRRR